jgi:hypothetical protein
MKFEIGIKYSAFKLTYKFTLQNFQSTEALESAPTALTFM